jgi:hypothetical protein
LVRFITKLKTRQYNWDRREWYENNESDGSKMEEKLTAGCCQELDEVQTRENAQWLNLVLKDNTEKWGGNSQQPSPHYELNHTGA